MSTNREWYRSVTSAMLLTGNTRSQVPESCRTRRGPETRWSRPNSDVAAARTHSRRRRRSLSSAGHSWRRCRSDRRGGGHEQDDAVSSLRVEGRARSRSGCAASSREKDAVWDELVAEHPERSRGAARRLEPAHRGRSSRRWKSVARRSSTRSPSYRRPIIPARRVIDEHRAARARSAFSSSVAKPGFENPDLRADQFFFLLEGAKSCVQCIGLKRVGEHLMQLVNTMVGNRKPKGRAKAARR